MCPMVMPKQHPHLDNKEGFLRWFLASDQGGNFGYRLLAPYQGQKNLRKVKTRHEKTKR